MRKLLILLAVVVLFAAACSSDDDSSGGDGSGASTDGPPCSGTESDGYTTLRVPDDCETIQDAVDSASEGDLVLIGEGTYTEGVIVEKTDNIVIRGVDRNTVILDGEFDKENGFKVFSNGVAVENLTVRNYTQNGVFFTGTYDEDVFVDGYRASYVTAHNNGVYGIYARTAQNGQFDHTYASGSSDAGYYIGECDPCNGLLYEVTAENNNLGYSGTNSSDVVIASSTWTGNRLGIVPNSQDGEALAPVERNTYVGNLVYDNNNPDTPEQNDNYRIGTGSGILIVGANETVVERNTVVDNERTNIVIFPWIQEIIGGEGTEGNDYFPVDNRIVDNITGGAVVAADLVLAMIDSANGPDGNCFAGNVFETSLPDGIETVAPCDGEGQSGFQTILERLDALEPGPEPIPYEEVPAPELDFENMPDAESAPPEPATGLPMDVDLDAIQAPPRPE